MRDVDAIGGRAVDGVDAVADRFEPQRTPQRQRVSDRARFGLRRDDRDLAERCQRGRERLNPRREVAVVIRHQNAAHVLIGS